ncbi:MAG: proline--tRNA ligase, partial [Anaerolineaceae bacterium]|nr:proline--tRNA ligase [Anaerolineaceae bacterium]
TMLDSYSLDATNEGLDEQYQAHYRAYFNIFERCGLKAVAVQSDTGMMGGKMAHEYMYLTPIGEDTLLFCDSCGYSANRQVAGLAKPKPEAEAALPMEKIATPNTTTIQDLAELLQIPASRTAKAVFMVGVNTETENKVFVFAIVRGDMDANETKLANVLKLKDMRPALEEEILAVGAVPGYASPVGLKNVQVVVDDLIPDCPNLVAGANEAGYHLRNVNYGRDYQAKVVADIASAHEGDGCPNCGKPMRQSRGVEVGNIFKLGTRYTSAMGCNFLDENGENNPVIMGSYGIGVGRLLACVAEEHHDEKGLIWPVSIAPFPVHLVVLPGKNMDVRTPASQIEQALIVAGMEPLVDDRDESAGVKFNDADLIGLPLRVTISERALKQGGAEFKLRAGGDAWIVPMEKVIEEVKQALKIQ